MFRTFNAFTNGNSYWPSSGFFSLVILSRVCSSVHGFGFIDPAEDDGHAYLAEHQLFRNLSLDQEAEVKLYLYPPDKTGVPVGYELDLSSPRMHCFQGLGMQSYKYKKTPQPKIPNNFMLKG